MRRLLLVGFLALAPACGGEPEVVDLPPEVVVPPPAPDEVEREPGEPEPVFGADGALLESSDTAAGLTLPRGLEVVVDEERRHVYRTRTPIDTLVAYLGPRLDTAEVTRTERGAVTYVGARPTGATSGPRIDVTVSPTSGLLPTRLEIELEPETALGEPSEDEVRRRLEALATAGE